MAAVPVLNPNPVFVIVSHQNRIKCLLKELGFTIDKKFNNCCILKLILEKESDTSFQMSVRVLYEGGKTSDDEGGARKKKVGGGGDGDVPRELRTGFSWPKINQSLPEKHDDDRDTYYHDNFTFREHPVTLNNIYKNTDGEEGADVSKLTTITIYLIRHGQGYHNLGVREGGLLRKIPAEREGLRDSNLTPLGKYQAIYAGRKFYDKVDDLFEQNPLFFVSDLYRTKQTMDGLLKGYTDRERGVNASQRRVEINKMANNIPRPAKGGGETKYIVLPCNHEFRKKISKSSTGCDITENTIRTGRVMPHLSLGNENIPYGQSEVGDYDDDDDSEEHDSDNLTRSIDVMRHDNYLTKKLNWELYNNYYNLNNPGTASRTRPPKSPRDPITTSNTYNNNINNPCIHINMIELAINYFLGKTALDKMKDKIKEKIKEKIYRRGLEEPPSWRQKLMSTFRRRRRDAADEIGAPSTPSGFTVAGGSYTLKSKRRRRKRRSNKSKRISNKTRRKSRRKSRRKN